jgi:hypothetical protein
VSRVDARRSTEGVSRVRPKAAAPNLSWPGFDELLTPNDVMAILKVSDVRTARRYMLLAGGFRLGRDYRIRRQALISWIEHRENDGRRPPSGIQTRAKQPRADAADWRARIKAAAR